MPDPADTGKNIKTTGTNVASEVNAGAGAKALGKQPGTDPCANGGQGNGQATSRGSGEAPGVFRGVNPQLASDLQSGAAAWNAAHADTGLKAVPFSGVSSRSVATSKHPSGNAVDYVIVDKNGCALNNLWNGDTPAYRAYESLAAQMCQSSNGRTGWGGNFGGTYFHDTMHFQSGGPVGSRGRVCEGKKNPYIPNNSDPTNTRYDGPTNCQEANAGQGESRGDGSGGGGGGCAEGGGGGCKPISSGAPGAAASMMQGQGLAANGPMGAALGAFGAMGSNPMAAIQGMAQQALGSALGGILPNGAGALLGGGGIGSLLSGGLSNPLTQITSQVGSLVQGIGGSILPGLTGVIPSLLQGGSVSGLLTGVIQNQVGTLLQSGMPNLGGFGQVFNTAAGAAASGGDLKNALMGSVTQVFGNATQSPLATSLGAAASGGQSGNLPLVGFDITSKLTSLGLTNDDGKEGIADNLVFVQTKLKPAANITKDLTMPFASVLADLTKNPKMNGFSSMYFDYNSMITQGFGNLSNNMKAFSTDLTNLGDLGDLTDLLNIGTPGQLIRQIIEKGLGIITGVTPGLVEKGLTLQDLIQNENDDELFDILDEIDDSRSIKRVKDKFKIAPTIQLETLADLLLPEVIFPLSNEFNNFEELRDIALTLSVCGGAGRLETLGQLGSVLASLETAEEFTELLDENQPIRIDEFVQLSADMPTESYFSPNGPTIADFIGSIAGYVHNDSLPRIDELLNELYADPVTDVFFDLMMLLTDTLSAPTIVNVLGIDYVRVPAVDVYAFGDYLKLDDAILDIVDAVNYELGFIKTLAESDEILEAQLYELDALHYMSAEFLAHEQKMRGKYGIEFGDPNRVVNYKGDNSTLTFPLVGQAVSSPQVFVSGVQQIQTSSYSYNSATNQVTFNTPPASTATISIKYQVDSIKPESRASDIWQLATSLETIALDTGHGSPADFLGRLVTNDYHGQRIMAVMMQARNNARLSNFGIACPAFHSNLTDGSDMDKTVDFVNHTGIWSDNTSRAAEIWIQNSQNVEKIEDYILTRFKANKEIIQNDLDNVVQNITRQLLFYDNGNIVMSDLMAQLYQNNQGNEIFNQQRDDLFIGWSNELPTDGYILGPYKEIVSKLTDTEGLKNTIFNNKLSNQTESYLKDINIDLEKLVTICQRILLINSSKYLGITEADVRSIFGIQSVSKAVLKNLSMDY